MMRRLIGSTLTAFGVAGLLLGSTFLQAQEAKEKAKPSPEPAKKRAAAEKKTRPAQEPAKKEEAKTETVVEEVMVVPTAPAAAPADAEDLGEKDPQVLQWMQQLRPFVRSEFHVVVTVCEPTAEQRRKLADAFNEALRSVAKRWNERLLQQQRNGFIQGEPDAIVRECVAAIVKPILTPEQAERYTADIEARDAHYKEVAARGVVAVLDQELHLSQDQRDKIGKALAENWDDDWLSSLQVLNYGLRFFPSIPDQHIAPFLDESQKKIWQSIPKNQRISFGLASGLNNQVLEDALRKGTAKADPEGEKAAAPAPE